MAYECHKSPLLEGVQPGLLGLLWVHNNKIPQEWSCPCRLSCSLTWAVGGLDLVMEDKGTPHAAGAPLAPCGQGLQRESQVTPGTEF